MNNYIIAGIVAIVLIGGGMYLMNSNGTDTGVAMTANDQKMAADKAAADKMMADKAAATITTTTTTTSKPTGVMVGGALMVPNLDIVANAMNASNVTTVVAAVKAAGLVETLQGAGPFTVFAPNNAAFEKLPAGTVDTLLKPSMKADLTTILTYHVVPGRYTSADLKDGMTLKTVNGATLKISVVNGIVKINGAAMVETADVISSNGVTHVIDTVLMPPKVKQIWYEVRKCNYTLRFFDSLGIRYTT